ncbi:MAG: ABC transporter ATP-binding protein, partial [Myxococcales bacterium]|nr:ABC transporter ATP-binding protein [Myxococcales bacterium]
VRFEGVTFTPPGAPKAPPGAASSAARGTEVVKLAITRESAMVSEFAVSVLTGLPQSVTTLIILAVELMTSDAWFALGGGLVLFVTSRLLADRASRRVGEARREMTTADAAVFASLQEKLSTTEDLRLWGARGEALGEFAATAHACSDARTRFAEALAVAGQIKSVFTAMSPLLIVVALKLSGRSYDAGEIAKLLLLVPLLMSRLEALDALRSGLVERAPLLVATLHIMNLPPAPARARDARRIDLDAVDGHVRFEGVTFTPPGAARPVLSDVSLDVPAGSVVGVCGPSGSGKSTVVRMLLRLDEPDAGRITIDGTEVAAIEPEQLPALFGVVRQTSQLLQRPVRDNLGIGLAPKPSDEAMLEALGRVRLDELARQATPDRSLATPYTHNPPNFSGGEVRRLLLARMLLGRAPVCVLDEPEAGLPSGTAEEILKSIVELARGSDGSDGGPARKARTCLVVTHAPHLLPSAFNVVLDKGRVIATGTHAELQQSCEPYRALLADALKD